MAPLQVRLEEALGIELGGPQLARLEEHDRPGGDGHEHQKEQDRLDDEPGLENQIEHVPLNSRGEVVGGRPVGGTSISRLRADES